MPPVSSIPETAWRVLRRHSAHISAAGPWRWSCALQDGSLDPMLASLSDGFLHLECRPHLSLVNAPLLERAMRANGSLRGGVRLALDASSQNLHIRADVPIFDELQLARAMEGVIGGFRHGFPAADGTDPQTALAPPGSCGSSAVDLAAVLRDVPWQCSQRSADEFSVELEAEAAPPVTLVCRDGRVEAGVELVRCSEVYGARLALNVFLLTANSTLCFCHACSQPGEGEEIYRLRACLSPSPTPEEVESALSALSVGYRLCAREACFLLNEAAAQVYLSARSLNSPSQSAGQQED